MKTLSLVAWLVAMMMIAPLADAADKDGKSFAQYSTIDKHDVACDCCMQCKAATRDVNGHPKAGGCRGCCERCDKKLPIDKDKIPEILKNKTD